MMQRPNLESDGQDEAAKWLQQKKVAKLMGFPGC